MSETTTQQQQLPAVEVQAATRIFKYKEQELSDPNPNWTPAQVVNFYSNQYPDLTTATVGAGEVDMAKGVITYDLKQTLGTKG